MFYMKILYELGNSQKKAQKAWGKENGGSFGLGRKSLGSDTDTWS